MVSQQARSRWTHVLRRARRDWLFVAGGRITMPKRPRERRRTRHPTERSLTSFVRWGFVGIVMFPIVALAVGWGAYTRPDGPPTPRTWDDFWAWLARHPDGNIDTLALVAGASLSLFVATQIGSAVARRDDGESSAQAVGLDALTSIACGAGAVVSWLALPALTAGARPHPVDVAVALFVPLLCTWLSAFVKPSAESVRLAQIRASHQMVDLDQILAELTPSLPREADGRVLGSRAGDARRLAARVCVAAVPVGVVTALSLLLVAGMLGGWQKSPVRIALGLVLAGILAAAVYVVAAYQLSELEVTRLLDSAWLVVGLVVLGAGEVALAVLVVIGAWQGAGARGAALSLVLLGLPVLAAVLRRRSDLMTARAHVEVRRRAANAVRLERARMRDQAALPATPRAGEIRRVRAQDSVPGAGSPPARRELET